MTVSFTLTVNRNRSLIIAGSPNPVMQDLGSRIAGFFEKSPAATSAVLEGIDAGVAALAIYGQCPDVLSADEMDAITRLDPDFRRDVIATVTRRAACDRCGSTGVQPSGAFCACTNGTLAFANHTRSFR